MKYLCTVVVFAFALLSGCASKHALRATSNRPHKEMQIGTVTLRPHQVAPIDYLLQHPEQKGLLLAHYLGTGKTFTALGFAETIGNQPVIIIAPEYLRSNWQTHMERIGLKNKERYRFLSYEEAHKENAFENKIVIIDEVHHLIALMKSGTSDASSYTKLYQNLNKAGRILVLTGTPIFTDVSDIAYILNLVAGHHVLPLNEREFLDVYTKVERGRSLWRGHITESNILLFGLPLVTAALPLAFLTPYVGLISGVYFGGILLGNLALPIINASVPLNRYPLRSFNAKKMSAISAKYVSYFDYRTDVADQENYPRSTVRDETVAYNEKQIEYFLEFADMGLNPRDLSRLLRETSYHIDGDVTLESTSLQTRIRAKPFSGREIGNFHFTNDDGTILESPKFEKVFESIGPDPQGIVVYSSYYENGIQLFAEFLERKGLGGAYKILHPALNVREQIAMIASYNSGETKILLLHPKISEGISLEKTRAIHILEPLQSQALYEQVAGRAIRLNSHRSLPKELRHVDVFTWTATLSGLKAFLRKNNNWAARFNELNSVASFGKGQSQIDPNFYVKGQSPDELTLEKRFLLTNAMTSLKELMVTYSIEQVQNDDK